MDEYFHLEKSGACLEKLEDFQPEIPQKGLQNHFYLNFPHRIFVSM